MRHTKGPWKPTKDSENNMKVFSKKSVEIASVLTEKDLKLIVAAPDVLQLLNDINSEINNRKQNKDAEILLQNIEKRIRHLVVKINGNFDTEYYLNATDKSSKEKLFELTKVMNEQSSREFSVLTKTLLQISPNWVKKLALTGLLDNKVKELKENNIDRSEPTEEEIIWATKKLKEVLG